MKGGVLFVSATGWLGGPSRSLATVMRRLASKQNSVLASPAGELQELIARENAANEVVTLPRYPRLRRLSRALASIKVSAWLVTNRHRISVVHANGLSELNAVGFGALLTRTPVVVWSHSPKASPVAGRMARVWVRVLPKVRWLAASDIAATALTTAAGIASKSITVIANPIDPDDVAETPSSRHDEKRIIVGFFGEPTIAKGFPILIAAAKYMVDRHDIQWHLYTHIERSSTAWESAQSITSVKVIGRTVDVASAYSTCDIVFCPSLYESFGRVLAEAMASGVPVVASDLVPFRTLMGEETAGLLFPPGDAEAAAQAIAQLADDPSARLRMGAVGRARAAEYHPDLVVPVVEEIYASL